MNVLTPCAGGADDEHSLTTHDCRSARCDPVMDDGHLVGIGSHGELLAAGGRYAELYGIQSAAYAR